MNLDSLRLLRNILLRTALICYAILLLSSLLWINLGGSTGTGISQWFHCSPESMNLSVLYFLTAGKFYLLFIVLAPGLAIHWTLKKEQSKQAR